MNRPENATVCSSRYARISAWCVCLLFSGCWGGDGTSFVHDSEVEDPRLLRYRAGIGPVLLSKPHGSLVAELPSGQTVEWLAYETGHKTNVPRYVGPDQNAYDDNSVEATIEFSVEGLDRVSSAFLGEGLQQQAVSASAIARSRLAFLERLPAGTVVSASAVLAPLLVATLPPGALRQLLTTPPDGLVGVRVDSRVEQRTANKLAVSPCLPGQYTFINPECPPAFPADAQLGIFNDLGLTGKTTKIAIYENKPVWGRPTTLYFEHLAFGQMTVEYSDPKGTVYDDHATGVVGAAGAMYGTAFDRGIGAYRTNILFSNAVDQGACKSPIATNRAYEWMAARQPTVINESYLCSKATVFGEAYADDDGDGHVQDYYIRQYGLLVFKGAGNRDYPNNSACLLSANSICVGGYNSRLSPTLNPVGGTTQNPVGSDREEPDIMGPMVGDAPAVSAYAHLSEWSSVFGTSFASPSMAGFAALLKEGCLREGVTLSSLDVRAILRTASSERNLVGWRYSTPKLGIDHLDGAGVPGPAKALAFCGVSTGNEAVPGSAIVRGILDFSADAPAAPVGRLAFRRAPPESVRDRSVSGDTFGGSPLRRKTLLKKALREGDRFRATLSWNSCPQAIAEAFPVRVADLDLAIYNADRGVYLYVSNSLDDVNEGFDVVVPVGFSGEYEVFVMFDPRAACPGIAEEPFSFTWSLWERWEQVPSGCAYGYGRSDSVGLAIAGLLAAILGFRRKFRFSES